MRDFWPTLNIFNFDHVVYVFNPEDEESLSQARFDLLFLSSEEELRGATYSIVYNYHHYHVPIPLSLVSS